ncbi:hypothetical protein Hanom_Chr06g00568411 [Helianthus anomalus]
MRPCPFYTREPDEIHKPSPPTDSPLRLKPRFVPSPRCPSKMVQVVIINILTANLYSFKPGYKYKLVFILLL